MIQFEPAVEYPFGNAVIRKFVLENGLNVIIWEDHSSPVVAYQTWFNVGSGNEQPGRSGLAHLFEHLMFKGTKNLKAGEFDRLLEANGVSTNAATWLDWTYYRENLPADKLELVVKLEADRMENMVVDQAQLDTEKEVVRNERLLRVENDPEGLASEVMYRRHFGDHPYGHPTLGWMKDIEAINLKDALEFHRLYYSVNNATIVVVGDVATQRVMELIHEHYGGMKRQATHELSVFPPVMRTEPVVEVLEQPVSAPKVSMMYSAPPLRCPEEATFRVLTEVLFNSESARVRKLLVEDRELAVEVGGWYLGFKMAGSFEVQLSLIPGTDWQRVVELLDGEIESMRATGCTKRELDKGRNRFEASFVRSGMGVGSRAKNLGHYEVTSGDFREYPRLLEKVRAVSERDLLEVARKYLDPKGRTIVVSLPGKEG